MNHFRLVAGLLWAMLFCASNPASCQDLETQLRQEEPSTLAHAARREGDARRGAILFYQARNQCLQCHHDPAESPPPRDLRSGPDLTDWIGASTDIELVDALLRPSERIRPGYEMWTAVANDGQTFTGILKARQPAIVLRDLLKPEVQFSRPRGQLEELVQSPKSAMPEKLTNLLGSRGQFLDLLRYIMELRAEGRTAARRLKPAAHLFAAAPLPEYESDLDHAGMIRDLDESHRRSGEAIYNRLCINCHGDKEREGSLPTALRFATGKFRSGADPYTMYKTLTHGAGMMQPQRWMVPQQKYDVIHYIRETYLKDDNPGQYFPVTGEWLAGLPTGSSRGPAPRDEQPWVLMNYGSTLINTYEIGNDGSNFAYKGIAVRLDDGPGGISRGRHWMVFDHDTMRMAAAWSGDEFINWEGIHFDGRHNRHPRILAEAVLQNQTGPGWAEPGTGLWDDRRLTGRDDRHYGPLPRGWARYRGMSRVGDRTQIHYTVGETTVSEIPSLLSDGETPLYARHLEIGPRATPMVMRVADWPDGASFSNEQSDRDGHVVVARTGEKAAAPTAAVGINSAWAQSSNRQADDFDLNGRDFTIIAEVKTTAGGTLFAKTAAEGPWVPNGKALFIRGGRLCYDIGWVGAVQSRRRVNDGRKHIVAAVHDAESGRVTLWIDGRRDNSAELRPTDSVKDHVIRLGFAAANFPREQSLLDGTLGTTAFYQRQLSEAELQEQPFTAPGLQAAWNSTANEDSLLADIGPSGKSDLQLRAEERAGASVLSLTAGITGDVTGWKFVRQEESLCLQIPAGDEARRVTLWFGRGELPGRTIAEAAKAAGYPSEIPFSEGDAPRFPEIVKTSVLPGPDDEAFATDVLTRPARNPWQARVRLTGFDFYPDGDSAAVCAWDGDVWHVSGLQSDTLHWRRIATGLFQPLGLLIVDGEIHVTCRDQLVVLKDYNGDGYTDYYHCLNNDHQVTDHFHEFAMGLQRDAAGNFYYAKSARHALKAVVPHHGTLLRVTPDGDRTEILATGFRAANGVCLNPDGTFIVTDQEGHWNPKNRINWVREGGFYGNMFGYHDVTDSSDEAMEQPLCWITNSFDRSPAELLWVPDGMWGSLSGSLLNLSYGYGQIHVVPHEDVNGQMQGGMCALPIAQFPTGLVRGRFSTTDGALYACGMFAWAGNQQQPGGFYRIRRTQRPAWVPVQLNAKGTTLTIEFSEPLSAESLGNPENYLITAWDLKRTANYGSKHYNERQLQVESVTVAEDERTVTLEIPKLQPTWGMEVRCLLESPSGERVERILHNTIHRLGE